MYVKKKKRPGVLIRDAPNRSNSGSSSSAENFFCFLQFFYRNYSFFHLYITEQKSCNKVGNREVDTLFL